MKSIRERINNTAVMLDVDQAMDEVIEIKRNGLPRGLTTGWRGFDEYYKIPPYGQLNVVTGYPGSGKSSWIESLAINMINIHDWKVFLYSPENYPPRYHLRGLCEKMTEKPFFDNWNTYESVTETEINQCREKIKNNLAIVDCHINNCTIAQLINSIMDECLEREVQMAIIDPWNKVESVKPSNMSETKFIGQVLTRLQMFGREQYIHFWIVAHPAKPSKLKDGSWSKCTLYDISDSANWYNMVDNGFILFRSWGDKVSGDDLAQLTIAKIKDQDYGKCGECQFQYERAIKKYKGVYTANRELSNAEDRTW